MTMFVEMPTRLGKGQNVLANFWYFMFNNVPLTKEAALFN